MVCVRVRVRVCVCVCVTKGSSCQQHQWPEGQHTRLILQSHEQGMRVVQEGVGAEEVGWVVLCCHGRSVVLFRLVGLPLVGVLRLCCGRCG